MKKFLSVFLSIVMIVSSVITIPITSYAWTTTDPYDESQRGEPVYFGNSYNYFEKDNLKYEIISSKKVKLLGLAANVSVKSEFLKNFVIPETVAGYTVTEIEDEAFKDNSVIESVEIPDSIITIGYRAFGSCANLKSIKVGKNIKNITDFFGTAFYNNKKNWKDGCLYIGTYLLSVNSNVKNVKIRKDTTVIGAYAFGGCTKITEVTVPDSVKYINDYAFYQCKNLKKVSLGNKIKEIGIDIFDSCEKFSTDKDGYIGKYFFGCKTDGKKTIKIKEGTRVIANDAFYISNRKNKNQCAEKLILPKSIVNVGLDSSCSGTMNAFWKLKTIEVDKDNKYYTSKNGVLFNKKMTKLVIYPASKENPSYTVPASVTTLGNGCFCKNQNLKYLKLNDGLININDSALYETKNIDFLVLPKSIKFIKLLSTNVKYSENTLMTCGIKFGVYPNTAGEKYAKSVYDDGDGNYVHFTYAYVCDKHNFVSKKGKAATYFSYGYTDYQLCHDCGMFKGFKQISKLKLSTPKATIKAGKGSLKISYKKVKDATGFQVKYTKGKNTATKTYKTAKSATKTIKKLKKGSYKVQVRTYIEKDGKKAYSSWSNVKTVKVK